MDPTTEIFNGEPEEITPEKLIEMDQEGKFREAQIKQDAINAGVNVESATAPSTPGQPQDQQSGGGATAQPTQQTEPPKTEEEKKEDKQLSDMSLGIMGDDGQEKNALGQTVGFVGGMFAAAPLAIADFGIDLVNLIPGVDVEKLPKLSNGLAQATREITSVLAPTVFTGGLAAPIAAAAKASKFTFLTSKLATVLGKGAWMMGTGAAVDYVSSTSEEDNLAGTLKQNFPRQFGWISDDIATTAADSVDDKKRKNVFEGMGLGLFVDIVHSAAKGLSKAKFLPGPNSKLKPTKPTEGFVENIELGHRKREAALDELGLSKTSDPNFEITGPELGVHNNYGYAEEGIRSLDDMGIAGARVDNARILNNVDSINGRVGNFVSEPVIKSVNLGKADYGDLIEGLGKQIADAGEYGFRTETGKVMKSAEIDESMDRLAKALDYPTRGEIEKAVNNIPADMRKGLIRKTFEEIISFDNVQARALLQTSQAGQMADLAEGMRLTAGSGSTSRGMDQLLDRMEFLMIADADARGQRNFFDRFFKNRFRNKEGVVDAAMRNEEMVNKARREAQEATSVLREIKETSPEMLEPLMFTYEASGGNVKTINQLNNYFADSTGVLKKAFIDKNPDTPSVVLKGFWGTVYNNVLSAFGTPLRAAASNAALLIEKPVATMAGAMISGDSYTLRRGFYQIQNLKESFNNGLGYMGQVFRWSGLDPDFRGVPGRESMMVQNSKQLDAMRSFAEAKAKQGDMGPTVMMERVDMINNVANHPWLRFGNRSMQALDGFVQAFVGTMESRGRAFDMVSKGLTTKETMEETQKELYNQMFKSDELGRQVISDDAVKYMSGEIAMNLDSPMNDALSAALKSAPGLKPFMLFTRTPINGLKFAGSHNPLALFSDQLSQFGRKFDEVPTSEMEQLLASKGIPFDDNAEIAYNAIKSELKGRKAIGMVAVTGAVGLFMNDSITGDGIANKQAMKLRRDANWKPRSIRLPGGNWVSYDGIPGISDFLALTANIMDNMDTLDPTDMETLLAGAGHVIGASITEKSGLTSVEPLFDILRGDPTAIKRWATGFIPSATIPGANQLAELTKLFSPSMRVVDDNLAAMIANRTPLKALLPEQYDWIDGGKVGEPDNFFARVWNTYSPFKVSGKITEEKQFLIDIEYDNRPSMATDGKGVELTAAEQSAVYSRMGQDGYFKKELRRIMQTADGKKFREALKDARRSGVEVRLQDFQSLHLQIDRALNLAKENAVAQVDLESDGSISERRFNQNAGRQFSRTGDIDGLLSIPK